MTIANAYLDAISVQRRAEAALDEALLEGFMVGDGDWYGDPYDRSLELFVPTLPPERVDALGAFVLSLGFARCWIHRHAGRRDQCSPGKCDRERYYAASFPASETLRDKETPC